MNYRHAYHAGNFADVLKHVVFSRILVYLQRKEAALRVIDTHAGTGLYDLSSEEAQKTGEWRDGIGRLLAAELPRDVAELLAPYLDAVRAVNGSDDFSFYPGSPMIARHLLRRQDRLTAIELHPKDALALKERFAGDHQARIIELDGWLAMGAHVPPKEKRGLVLVDPPFERPGEFGRMIEGLQRAYRRWPGGTYALWYPIKNAAEVTAFRDGLAHAGIAKIIDITLEVTTARDRPGLAGSGMIVVNPPFLLAQEMEAILSALVPALQVSQGSGRGEVAVIVGEE